MCLELPMLFKLSAFGLIHLFCFVFMVLLIFVLETVLGFCCATAFILKLIRAPRAIVDNFILMILYLDAPKINIP